MNVCSVDHCTSPSRARTWCKFHYNLWYRTGSLAPVEESPRYSVCQAPDCEARPRSPHCEWCEKHYCRLRRNGSLDLPERAPCISEHGYVVVKCPPDHSLSVGRRSPTIYLHQLIAFDTYGFGPHLCHWCSTPVTWRSRSTAVDHVDGDKLNNSPANLVLACTRCNTHRANPVTGHTWHREFAQCHQAKTTAEQRRARQSQ